MLPVKNVDIRFNWEDGRFPPKWLMGTHMTHSTLWGRPAPEADLHTNLTAIQHNSLLLAPLLKVLPKALPHHTLFPPPQEKVPPIGKLSRQ